MSRCRTCGKKLKLVTNTHLRSHQMKVSDYKVMFPHAKAGFPTAPCQMDKNDPKFIKWRKSLQGKIPWNKGQTKETHPSLAKLARTMASKPQSNFENWLRTKRKVSYPSLKKTVELAELVGIILGDGSLGKLPRTEALYVSCNSKDMEYVARIADLIEQVLQKKPKIYRSKTDNFVRIRIYQNDLSKRLQIPPGNKIKNNVSVPVWIKNKREFVISCLKGLFETDGCFNNDRKYYTYVIEFKNYCHQLLEDVFEMVEGLGYNPQKGKNYVRLARQSEVKSFMALIDFRPWRKLNVMEG